MLRAGDPHRCAHDGHGVPFNAVGSTLFTPDPRLKPSHVDTADELVALQPIQPRVGVHGVESGCLLLDGDGSRAFRWRQDRDHPTTWMEHETALRMDSERLLLLACHRVDEV